MQVMNTMIHRRTHIARKRLIPITVILIGLLLSISPQKAKASAPLVEKKSVIFWDEQKKNTVTADTASIFPISEDNTASIGLRFGALPKNSGAEDGETVWHLSVETTRRGMQDAVSPGNLTVSSANNSVTTEVAEGRSVFFTDYYAAEGKKSYQLELFGTVNGELRRYYATLETTLLPRSALERSGTELRNGALKLTGSRLLAEVVLPASEQGKYFYYSIYDKSGALVFASETAECALYRSIEDERYAFLERARIETPGAVLQLSAALPSELKNGEYTIRLKRENGAEYAVIPASVQEENRNRIQLLGVLTSDGIYCRLLTDGTAPGEVGLHLLRNGIELKGLWELVAQSRAGNDYEAVRVLRNLSVSEGGYTLEARVNGRCICAEELYYGGEAEPVAAEMYCPSSYVAEAIFDILGARENEIYRAELRCEDGCVAVCESVIQNGLLDVEFVGANGEPERLQSGKHYRIRLQRSALSGWVTVSDYVVQRKNSGILENIHNFVKEDTEKLYLYFFQPLQGELVCSGVVNVKDSSYEFDDGVNQMSKFRQYKTLIYRDRNDCILIEPKYVDLEAALAQAENELLIGSVDNGSIKCIDSESGEVITELCSGREVYVQAIPDEGYMLKTGSVAVNGESLVGRSFLSSGTGTVIAEFVPDSGVIPTRTRLRFSNRTAELTVSGLSGRTGLWLSVYDENGAMLSVEQMELTADGVYRYTVSERAAAEVRCFLTDATGKPIAEAAAAYVGK